MRISGLSGGPFTVEGVQPALIENAAKLVGMPLGPLQLTDETSIDLGAKIARATKAAMGDAYPDGAVDEVIFWMEGEGRLGRKAKAGFYDYDDKGKRQGLWEGLAAQYPVAEDQPDLIEVQHRLLFAQVLEAVRALEEGVLEDIREGDVGAGKDCAPDPERRYHRPDIHPDNGQHHDTAQDGPGGDGQKHGD